jgi:hypothetical protein
VQCRHYGNQAQVAAWKTGNELGVLTGHQQQISESLRRQESRAFGAEEFPPRDRVYSSKLGFLSPAKQSQYLQLLMTLVGQVRSGAKQSEWTLHGSAADVDALRTFGKVCSNIPAAAGAEKQISKNQRVIGLFAP